MKKHKIYEDEEGNFYKKYSDWKFQDTWNIVVTFAFFICFILCWFKGYTNGTAFFGFFSGVFFVALINDIFENKIKYKKIKRIDEDENN